MQNTDSLPMSVDDDGSNNWRAGVIVSYQLLDEATAWATSASVKQCYTVLNTACTVTLGEVVTMLWRYYKILQIYNSYEQKGPVAVKVKKSYKSWSWNKISLWWCLLNTNFLSCLVVNILMLIQSVHWNYDCSVKHWCMDGWSV